MIVKRILAKIKRKLDQLIHGNFNVPVGNDYFGKKAEIYESNRKDSEFWKREEEFVDQAIGQLINKNQVSKLLDIPAGTGRFYPLYEKYSVEYIGGDASTDMLDKAALASQNSALGKNIKMFSHQIPLPDNSVDLIVCFRFLQWIIPFKDVRKTLIEFNRVTKKYCLIELSVGKHETSHKPINENLTMWDNLNFEEISLLLLETGFRVEEYKFLSDDEENPNMHGFLCVKI